jgi:SNF2 family DNA or RNA helicase
MRRDETGLPFPSRDIDHVLVDNRSQLEQQLYNDVLTVLRGIYRRHLDSTAFLRRPSGKEEGVPQIVLVAVLVLRELASHPLAAIKTLSRPLVRRAQHLARVTGDTTDLDALDRILNQYSRERWQEGSHSKTDSLITQLPELVGNYGRVIVYVEFRETQKVIVERLQRKRQVGLPTKTDVISYHGGLTLAEKSHQIDRFNSHQHACLVSTDAGGQGLNLQEGNVVVNFDFPWNPMRVEQRIGRVDRMGQKASRIVVRNFITIDTIEQYVYQTLREKLRVCEDVLGHLVPPIFRLRRIEDRYSSQDDVLGIGHIILSSENDVDLRQKFLALGSELDEQLSRREAVWRPPPRWIDG